MLKHKILIAFLFIITKKARFLLRVFGVYSTHAQPNNDNAVVKLSPSPGFRC
jgi:hypothetical protein